MGSLAEQIDFRALGQQAEAERERRAKDHSAEGEYSARQEEAGSRIGGEGESAARPAANLSYALQTLVEEMGAEREEYDDFCFSDSVDSAAVVHIN